MTRWFRAYDEAVDDPKLQRLPGEVFKALFNLWCLASQNGGLLPHRDDIAFKLRMKPQRVDALLSDLTSAGLIDEDSDGKRPHNWNGRQYKSDVSNDRVKRHRERQCNVTDTVTVTPPEADTEQNREKETLTGFQKVAEAIPPKPLSKKGTRLSPDFVPDESCHELARKLGMDHLAWQRSLETFHDYWPGMPGQRGCKLDWNATFRNWLRNQRGTHNGSHSSGYKSNSIAGGFAILDEAFEQRERELSEAESREGNGPENPETLPRLRQGHA